MLLHCEGARVLPPCCTGSKGEPVATMARPSVQLYAWRRCVVVDPLDQVGGVRVRVRVRVRVSVQLYASAGVTSQEEVGLERGKTMGRSCASAIARIAASGGVRGRVSASGTV